MRKLIIIFLVVFPIILFPGDRTSKYLNFSWVKIKTGTEAPLFFVSGKNKTDFWVQTSNGILINIKNSKPIFLRPPSKFRLAFYYKISKNSFLCSATDLNWHGVIYRITNGIWHKFNFNSNAPLHQIFKLKNSIFIVGDEGTLIKLNGDNRNRIKTPFESHIISGITYNGKLYLSTRKEGVYRFNGKEFFHYKNSSQMIIKELKIIRHKVFAKSLKGIIFRVRNGNLTEIKDKDILESFFPSLIKNHLGYGYLANFNKSGEKIILQFPENYNIQNSVNFNDSSFALLSKDGNIYISRNSGENKFTEAAAVYRVDDLPNSQNTGAAFFDANNDNIPDLLLTNNSSRNFLGLFKGVKNSPFANLTSTSGLPFNKFRINFFALSDLNKDGLIDIILEGIPDSLHKIMMYENLGEFKFRLKKEIEIPADLQIFGIRQLSTFDYDNDGDDDIIVTSYYGPKNNPGYVLMYNNSYWGSLFSPDTTLVPLTNKWNSSITFADFNNDDKTDYILANYWASDILGINVSIDDKLRYKLADSLFLKGESLTTLLSDFDNDGDLDIFTLFTSGKLNLYKNNGNNKFIDYSEKIHFAPFEKQNSKPSVNMFNLGDFNNDGFCDIIAQLNFNGQYELILIKNNNGKDFSADSTVISSGNLPIAHSAIADIDEDGDLDIYCATNKHNLLYLNNLDCNNFINIKLHGIKSTTEATGAKVWAFQKDKTDSGKYLLGYKQLGADETFRNQRNTFTIHFGLRSSKNSAVKIRFSSGKEIYFPLVKKGTTLDVQEYSGIQKTFFLLPGVIYRFASQTENQIYFFTIFLSLLIIYFGLRYGYKNNYFTSKNLLVFSLLDLTLFSVSVYVASFSSNEYLKYLVPLSVAVLSGILPLTILVGLKKLSRDEIKLQDERLLQLVISFSHGKWALRNLNSLILLCQNPSPSWETNNEFKTKLKLRFETFNKLTLPALSEILNIEKTIEPNNKDLKTIFDALAEVESGISDELKNIEKINLNSLALQLSIIRTGIKEIRDSVFSRFSSFPTEVINNVINETSSLIADNNIIIEKKKLFTQKIPALIKSHELANIIDNLLHNSIRFMETSPVKRIDIIVKKESPKIIISWSNTGEKIPENKSALIFEQGYSESKSTGRGLFEASKILKKYDGRIFLKSSSDERTTFIIELNEGIIK